MSKLPQWHEPGIDQAELLIAKSSGNASAGSVTTDDDMLDLQVLHRVLDDRQRIKISRDQDVGDVAMDENVAGI